MAKMFAPWISKTTGDMIVATDYDAAFVADAKALGATFVEIKGASGTQKGWKLAAARASQFDAFRVAIAAAKSRVEAKRAQIADQIAAKRAAEVRPATITANNLAAAMYGRNGALYG